ncbi:SdrD B-like domain-containing protein [Arthrobacter sp. 35W]|uniref:SdrD B-like domain-containing protein n=1 Tax=Arthrobacter sp. 35W TaxID=1132441 RepID=UPI0012DBF50F|nr:SdrD B-like domain-containing protein [Arthrobacter sp. 35W]
MDSRNPANVRHRWRRALAALLVATLGLGIGGAVPALADPAPLANASLTLSKTVDKTSLAPGESATYSLQFGCSSNDVPCFNAVLEDVVPAPLVVTDVRAAVGFDPAQLPVIVRAGEGDRNITITMKESAEDYPGIPVLSAGSDRTVLLTVQLPAGTSPQLDGTKLVNAATIKADNATSVPAEAPAVVVNAKPTLGASIKKSWAEPNIQEGATTSNALTLHSITNTSNVGASSLTITEPSGGTDPFAAVQFTGFGQLVFPEGADRIQVIAITSAGEVRGAAAATAVLPNGVAAADVKGFKFLFTSTASTDAKGGIVSNGTAGSIVLNTNVRAGAKTGTVDNTVSITAETPKDTSAPATDTAKFTIAGYSVEAAKSFTPPSVVAETAETQGRSPNTSTVTLGAKNTSKQPLTTLGVKEPAAGTDPFGKGISFKSFVATPWPAGAQSGVLTIGKTEYPLVQAGGNIVFPAGLPETISSFEVAFTGTFAPQSSVGIKFTVTGDAKGNYVNTVQAAGSAGGTPVVDEESATLEVRAPIEKTTGGKSFSPNRVEGIAGDATVATLSGAVDSTTNVDVRKIVLSDEFSSDFSAAWRTTFLEVKANEVQGADSVIAEYKNSSGAWLPVPGALPGKAYPPADAAGIRVTYTRNAGSFPVGAAVKANLGVELKATVADLRAFENVLVVPNGTSAAASVAADKKLHISSGKSWQDRAITQKPSDLNPKTSVNLSATNTSTYAVDSLTITDPQGGARPFDYVDATNVEVYLVGGATPETARLKLTLADTTTIELSGAAAVTPASVTAAQWAQVTGIEFSLQKTGNTAVPRDSGFDLSVKTKLRSTLRGSATDIDTALRALSPAYTIPNTAVASISRGADELVDTPKTANLQVITQHSVTIGKNLTKSFSPGQDTTLFPTGGARKPIDVTLGLDTVTDKADKILFEDTDPTFWNAFDFTAWKAINSGPTKATLTLEYLTGATFSTAGGPLAATGGEWKTYTGKTTKNGLPSGDIQGFRITIAGDDYTELDRTKHEIVFSATPRYTLRSGGLNSTDQKSANPSEAKNSTVANTVSGDAWRLGKEHKPADATAERHFLPGVMDGKVSKKVNGAASVQASAGEELTYTLQIENKGSEPLVDPVFTDSIPTDAKGPQLVLAEDFASRLVFTKTPDTASITVDPTKVVATADDPAKLVFSFPSGTVLYPGESYTITVPMSVRAGLPGSIDPVNTLAITTGEVTVGQSTAKVDVMSGQAYDSRKLVREVPADGDKATGVHNTINAAAACHEFKGGFYRAPCVVETKPGGVAEWKIELTNAGNVDSSHVELVDIFPWAGDHGVVAALANSPRGSQWTPTFLGVTGLDVKGADYTLEYLTSAADTCKTTGTATSGDPWAGCSQGWVKDKPANPKNIFGLKLVLDFPQGLAPTDGASLTFRTQSATEMPAGVAGLAPAWNSFGYYAEATVDGKVDRRVQEPIKTGITFRPEAKEMVSVGDYVWVDVDRDGRQDAGEPAIKDVVLKLTDQDGNQVKDVYGNIVLETMTDAAGAYLFANLPVPAAGKSYKVSIDRDASAVVLAQYIPTLANQGGREGDSSTWTASSQGLAKDGDHDPTLDFGFVVPMVSVGDYVWFDADRDGLQGSGEKGIPGVVLTLAGPDGKPVTDINGNPVGPVATTTAGLYTFEKLPVLKDGQSYTVSIDRKTSEEVLAAYVPTKETTGNRGSDSSTWTASSQGLASDGDRDPSLDFGFVVPMVSVGDYVWFDADRDGLQGSGEKGIPGVVLTLAGPDGKPVTDINGNPVGPVATDVDGKYIFANLPVLTDGQHYTVSIDAEASKTALTPYLPTTAGAGGDRGKDSSTGSAESTVPLLSNGSHDPTLDFGFVLKPKVSVGDYVWVDEDRDGLQSKGEPGIEGVVLELVGPTGNPVTNIYGRTVGAVATDEHGKYTFNDLPVLTAGQSYTVKIVKAASAEALAPYVPTKETAGHRGDDSSTWTASSQDLVNDGDRDPTLDFGFVVPMVSLGDYVWNDIDRDGSQGKGEPGIEGVVLTLVGPDGKDVTDVFGDPVLPTTTDGDGWYVFENLPTLADGESYTVSIDRKASADALAPYIPTIETDDNRGGDSSTWKSSSEGLSSNGDHDSSLDFGFVLPKVSVGDYVWIDGDRDGLQGAGEKGLPGVVLILAGPDGKAVTDVFGDPVLPTATDANGAYIFENLPALAGGESYTVLIDRKASHEVLAPYVPTKETDGSRGTDSSTWQAVSTGLAKDGDHDPSLDFGFVVPMVSVGDYVWVDANNDGRQGAGEKGIPGVVLTLAGPDGKPVTDIDGNAVHPVSTDGNGGYLFARLPVLKEGQSYTVSIDRTASAEALAPYVPTKETEGSRGDDSSTWTSASQGLTNNGDQDATLDFGFVLKPALPVPPAGSGAEALGSTGFTSLGLALAGVLLLAAGGAVMVRRRATAGRQP